MQNPALKFDKPVIFMGPSHSSRGNLTETLTFCDSLVAADGGAEVALSYGIQPVAVIGDFDSFSTKMRDTLDPKTLIHVREQHSTDFAKCLTRVDAPLIFALGFSGGRLDHELACLNALVTNPEKRCVIIGETDLVFHVPEKVKIDLPVDTRISLFPMAPVSGKSTGLAWPIEGLKFAPFGAIGTSNRVVGPVSLEFDQSGMLVILPREHLSAVVEAMGG